jgi:hypothetical protein
MELALLVYFANFVDKLSIGFIFFILFLLLYCFVTAMNNIDSRKEYKTPRWVWVSGAACAVLLILTPKEKTVWLMAGAYGAQSVYESQAGQELKKLVELKIKGIVDAEMEKATKK